MRIKWGMILQFHLADLFEIVAKAIPDRDALIDDKRTITFRQLNERADRLASGLYNRGIRPGDKIGLYLMNGPEYLESFIASIKIGAVPFNVNYRYNAGELIYLFGNADAKAVIHGAEFSKIVADIKDALPTLSMSVAVDDGQGIDIEISSSEKYEQLMLTAPIVQYPIRDDNDYILQYTGGTTGMPKGVMWPHKAFFFACLGGGGLYAQMPPISQPEQQALIARNYPPVRIMPLAPLMHGAAIWAALSGLLGGLTLVLDPMRSGFDADSIWDRVEREQVNILQIVGDAMAVPLLESLTHNPGRWDLKGLFHFGSGGAVFSTHVKQSLKNLLPNCMMGDGMGTSETGISGMGEPAKDDGFMRLDVNDEQKVITEDRFAKVGEVGFLSRTGHTPIGYYNDPVKTAEIFVKIDGQIWVLTGDQARLDADNKMTIFGRGSTCINSGGEKIYPEEVEEVLRSHPSVHDAAVVGMPDKRWGQKVSAVISISKNMSTPDIDDVQNHCRSHLAGYKIPRTLLVVDDVARSPAGKQNYKWVKKVLMSLES